MADVSPESALERLDTANAELAAVQRDLEHNQRLVTIGTLAATAAHELNNLLTPVLGYAQLAQATPENPALTEKALEKTITGIKAAVQILEATRDFSRPADETTITPCIRTVIETALSLVPISRHDRVRIEHNVPHHLAVAISPLALQQVLVNLLVNARRAIGEARGTIMVTAAAENGWIRLSVRDDGTGIDPQIADRIFEPFVSDRGANEEPGSGLGLAVCRRAVEQREGRISFRSVPGEGTTFHVELRAAA